MNRNIFIYAMAFAMMTTTTSFSQGSKPVTNYLGVAGPIVFEKQSYNLSWSSHPSEDFYKQEYIAKGDVAERYKRMILLDVLKGQTQIKDIVAMKIAELKKMKAGNPIINYETFDNPKTDEYMIDFLVSANTPDGKELSIVEHNVYRYKMFTDKKGQKGVLLFGVSTRSYDSDINAFLILLKAKKAGLVNSISQFKIPEITIRN